MSIKNYEQIEKSTTLEKYNKVITDYIDVKKYVDITKNLKDKTITSDKLKINLTYDETKFKEFKFLENNDVKELIIIFLDKDVKKYYQANIKNNPKEASDNVINMMNNGITIKWKVEKEKKEENKDYTLVYVAVGVIGFIILLLILYAIYRSTKNKKQIVSEDI